MIVGQTSSFSREYSYNYFKVEQSTLSPKFMLFQDGFQLFYKEGWYRISFELPR